MSQQSNIIPSKVGFTNYFKFHDKLYGIDIDLFNKHSTYFHHFPDIKSKNEIMLLDDYEKNVPISEEAAEEFISYCQFRGVRESALNNKDTLVGIDYLADKYNVEELKSITHKYIADREIELAIQALKINPNDAHVCQKYEPIIADQFYSYVKDPSLPSVPIPNLYRIMSNVNVDYENEDVFKFLFECLRQTQGMASILFSNVHFGKKRTQYLQKLIDPEYNFDFHYLNSEYLRGIYDLEQTVITRSEELKDEQYAANLVAEERQKQYELLIDEVNTNMNELRRIQNSILSNINTEADNCRNRIKDEIAQMNTIKDQLINETSNEVNQMKNSILKIIDGVNQTKTSSINQLNETYQNLSNSIDKQYTNWEDVFARGVLQLSKEYEIKLKSIEDDTIKQTKNQNEELKKNLDYNTNCIHSLFDDQTKLNNYVGKLENVIYDMNYRHFFADEQGNIEKFNQLKGTAQQFIINNLPNYHCNAIYQSSLKNLLEYISINIDDDNYHGNYISLNNNSNISQLNSDISITIPLDISIHLSKQGKLNNGDFINHLCGFSSI